jgi:hypothetical protein
MNYFDSDMSKSTNTIIYLDEKDGNIYICLRTMSHTIYAAKFEQTITHDIGKFYSPTHIKIQNTFWLP